ncbi:unnamed protein product [Rotaria sp. Silwood2]|nr:unnamed protein product [Rotaria sp. Silwood2]
MSIATKVGVQIHAELGREIWAVQIPTKILLAVGIDTYRNSQSCSLQMVGFVASMKPMCTHALQKYHQVNGVLPAKIIIYRDGVNDIQLLDVIDSELPTLNELCMKVQEGYENRETRQMTKAFQYKPEGKIYCSMTLYDACIHAFDALPICALVDSRFLCMHAESPHSGPLCDVLLCDPSEKFDDIDEEQPDFKPNDVRGCAYFFSYYACRDFLLRNNLLSIIRGHEVQKDDVRFFRKSSRTNFPVIVSLFSAPNYCDTYNNVAVTLRLDANQHLSVIHIEAHSHPFVLPNYENGFQFGERFILYYTTHLLLSIFNMYSPEELAAEDDRKDKTDRPDIQALVNEAEKERIKNYDQAIQLDQIFERRPNT